MGQSKSKKRSRSKRAIHCSIRMQAGIDVGSQFHVVAVPADRDDEPVRSFQSFTGDLHRLADWLLACRIDTVAMESTGIYWVPLYEILQEKGHRCCCGQCPRRQTCPRSQDRRQRRAVAPTTARIRPAAGQLSPAGGYRRFASFCASANASWIMPLAYPAHAEGADADESAIASRRFDITGKTGMRIIRRFSTGP